MKKENGSRKDGSLKSTKNAPGPQSKEEDAQFATIQISFQVPAWTPESVRRKMARAVENKIAEVIPEIWEDELPDLSEGLRSGLSEESEDTESDPTR
jgi:hypothetical protein